MRGDCAPRDNPRGCKGPSRAEEGRKVEGVVSLVIQVMRMDKMEIMREMYKRLGVGR